MNMGVDEGPAAEAVPLGAAAPEPATGAAEAPPPLHAAADAAAPPPPAPPLKADGGRPYPPGLLCHDVDVHEVNDGSCHACGGGGDLILCDGCTAALHSLCAGSPPEEDEWYCPACRCAACRVPVTVKGSRRVLSETVPADLVDARPALAWPPPVGGGGDGGVGSNGAAATSSALGANLDPAAFRLLPQPLQQRLPPKPGEHQAATTPPADPLSSSSLPRAFEDCGEHDDGSGGGGTAAAGDAPPRVVVQPGYVCPAELRIWYQACRRVRLGEIDPATADAECRRAVQALRAAFGGEPWQGGQEGEEEQQRQRGRSAAAAGGTEEVEDGEGGGGPAPPRVTSGSGGGGDDPQQQAGAAATGARRSSGGHSHRAGAAAAALAAAVAKVPPGWYVRCSVCTRAAHVRCLGQAWRDAILEVEGEEEGGGGGGKQTPPRRPPPPFVCSAACRSVAREVTAMCARGARHVSTLADGTPVCFQLVHPSAVFAPEERLVREEEQAAAAADGASAPTATTTTATTRCCYPLGTSSAAAAPRYSRAQRAVLAGVLRDARALLSAQLGPVTDVRTFDDVLPWMVAGVRVPPPPSPPSSALGRSLFDASAHHVAVLWAGGTLVSAAVVRFLGTSLVETSMIATARAASGRRLGRTLMRCIERAAREAGVGTAVLPAIGRSSDQGPTVRHSVGVYATAPWPEAPDSRGALPVPGRAQRAVEVVAGAGAGEAAPSMGSATDPLPADERALVEESYKPIWGAILGYGVATGNAAWFLANFQGLLRVAHVPWMQRLTQPQPTAAQHVAKAREKHAAAMARKRELEEEQRRVAAEAAAAAAAAAAAGLLPPPPPQVVANPYSQLPGAGPPMQPPPPLMQPPQMPPPF